VTDIPNCTVLMSETSVHFLADIILIFVEFTKSIILNALDFISLSLQLVFKFVYKVLLLLLSLFSFVHNSFLNFASVFSQVLQNFSFFSYTSILFSLEIGEFSVHSFVNRFKLVVQTLDAV